MRYMITIYFANGNKEDHRFKNAATAAQFAKVLNYTDGTIVQVDLINLSSYLAYTLWDVGWDETKKHYALASLR